eukprot:CAMPEP_0201635330 /NCGR_PEP_ID=MMETSP0493-20130528/7915_1 /ASSEMBLY_ACC=CAM_ASM_000838 /TAXON_ID=420259 /ORGANISM="Thalassiosira gravida, Strain GMp14c1" /LENGTH=90 /DNA_ID=CAMNT_0048107285 /DNA_START=197 /DNA_END=469 /DNA_ORIENTATION=+
MTTIKAPTMETTPSPTIGDDDDDDDDSLFSMVNTPSSSPSTASSLLEVSRLVDNPSPSSPPSVISNVSHPTSVLVIMVHVKLLHPLSKLV